MDTQPPTSYWLFVILLRESQFEGYGTISYLCRILDEAYVKTHLNGIIQESKARHTALHYQNKCPFHLVHLQSLISGLNSLKNRVLDVQNVFTRSVWRAGIKSKAR